MVAPVATAASAGPVEQPVPTWAPKGSRVGRAETAEMPEPVVAPAPVATAASPARPVPEAMEARAATAVPARVSVGPPVPAIRVRRGMPVVLVARGVLVGRRVWAVFVVLVVLGVMGVLVARVGMRGRMLVGMGLLVVSAAMGVLRGLVVRLVAVAGLVVWRGGLASVVRVARVAPEVRPPTRARPLRVERGPWASQVAPVGSVDRVVPPAWAERPVLAVEVVSVALAARAARALTRSSGAGPDTRAGSAVRAARPVPVDKLERVGEG